MEETEFRTNTREGRKNLRQLFYDTHEGAEGMNIQMIGNINPICRWLEKYVEDDNYVIPKEEAYEYLRAYLTINNIINVVKETEEIISVKVQKDLYEKIRTTNLKIDGLEILFTTENLPIMFENIDIINDKIPDGFVKGMYIMGTKYHKENEPTENITIIKTFLTDDLNDIKQELSESGRLDEQSETYYVVNSINMFYEKEQGGTFKSINYDDMKGYNVYSPSSKNSCGRECLKYYGVEAPKGMLSLSDMKALSPVPVSDVILDVDEYILLRDNHYVRCIKMSYQNKQKIIKRLEITDEKIKKHMERLDKKKVIVYDLECFGNDQKPAMVGYYEDGQFKYYFGENCVSDFIKNLDCDYLIGYNCNKYDYILIKNEIIK